MATSRALTLEGSVVAATAEELRFTQCLEGRCLQRLRPTGRNDAQPPIDEDPPKELQAAPQVPTACAVAATTERSPPVVATASLVRHSTETFVHAPGSGTGYLSLV